MKATDPARDPAAYRRCVGACLINGAGRVWIGRRRGTADSWQMPQGGIDARETPRQAALREIREETGVRTVEILGKTRGWLYYDLPAEIVGRRFEGRYVGQRQKWFAVRFAGVDGEIDLDGAEPEFDAWRWATPEDVLAAIVDFKRDVYAAVLTSFGEFTR